MIKGLQAYAYCIDEISLIENYEQAVNDNRRKWVCHHRLGVDKPTEQLIEEGLYYHRPASELIFMTKSEHTRLHHKGKHPSEDTKNKISNAKTGVPQFHRRRKILQYTIDGDFIREWPSITEIERTLNILHSSIIAVCSGRYHHAGGYIWKYS